MITLNIGLNSKKLGAIRASDALQKAELFGLCMKRAAVVQSDTEPTLVIDTDSSLTFSTMSVINLLSDALGQDCIAAWDGQRGELIGRGADSWGGFEPAFFFTVEGTRLADLVAADITMPL